MSHKARMLIVGLGEVGSALYQVARGSGGLEVYGYDVDPRKTINRLSDVPVPVDYLHVAIPYSQRFV
ncbi:MAG: GDP-mannose dehydrogenase, partial [Thermofilum sp.]|nr:GDP-mannose dehydrogenase [Thermofilum sp.]